MYDTGTARLRHMTKDDIMRRKSRCENNWTDNAYCNFEILANKWSNLWRVSVILVMSMLWVHFQECESMIVPLIRAMTIIVFSGGIFRAEFRHFLEIFSFKALKMSARPKSAWNSSFWRLSTGCVYERLKYFMAIANRYWQLKVLKR